MISWLKERAVLIIGSVAGLFACYFIGKREGKNEAKNESQKNILERAAVARSIDNMPDADVDKLQSKYD